MARMGVYLADDMRDAIEGLDVASATTAAAIQDIAEPECLRYWREGYRAALVAVLVVFGLEQHDSAYLAGGIK